MRLKNQLWPIAVSLICILAVLVFLKNTTDIGFTHDFGIGDLIALFILISAIFGGFYAYQILVTTIDQRDMGFMPFLSFLTLSNTNSGVEINYRNYGQGPAIGVYWETRSANFKFKTGKPKPDVCWPNASTGLSREWLHNKIDLEDFLFDLICRDQVGNQYSFSYLYRNGMAEFIGTKKNNKLLV